MFYPRVHLNGTPRRPCLESRAGLARLEARLETSERRADSLQYRLARRGVEDEEEDFHVKTPKDPGCLN